MSDLPLTKTKRDVERLYSYSTLVLNRDTHTSFKTFKWRGCVRAIFEWANQRAQPVWLFGADWLRGQRSRTGRGALLILHFESCTYVSGRFVYHICLSEAGTWNVRLEQCPSLTKLPGGVLEEGHNEQYSHREYYYYPHFPHYLWKSRLQNIFSLNTILTEIWRLEWERQIDFFLLLLKISEGFWYMGSYIWNY